MGTCCTCLSKKQEETFRQKQTFVAQSDPYAQPVSINQNTDKPGYLNQYGAKWVDLVKDEEVKGVDLSTFNNTTDLLKLSQTPNNLQTIHALIKLKFKLESVTDITGLKHDTQMMYLDIDQSKQNLPRRDSINSTSNNNPFANQLVIHNLTTRAWNPIHFAIFSDQLLYVRYYLEQLQEPLSLAIRDPERFAKMTSGRGDAQEMFDEVFFAVVCINKKNKLTFNYLVNERGQYWNYKKLKYIILTLIGFKWIEGLQSVIFGDTFKAIFSSFTTQGKLQILEEIIDPLLESLDKQKDKTLIQTLLTQTLVQQPFVSVAFFNLIKGHYLKYYPEDQRDQTLKTIKQNIFANDIIRMGKDLKIVEIESFLKELSIGQQQFTPALFRQFTNFLKDGLTNRPLEFDRYYLEILNKCRNGTKPQIEQELNKLDGKAFNRCRGQPQIQIELLKSDQYSTIIDTLKWGPLLTSYGYFSYENFYMLLDRYRFNLSKELHLDPDDDSGEDTAAQKDELILFKMAIHKRSFEPLHLLLSPSLNFLINTAHIYSICNIMKAEEWYDGLSFIIQHKFTRTLFNTLKIEAFETKQTLIKGFHYPLQITTDFGITSGKPKIQAKNDLILKLNFPLCNKPYSIHLMIYILNNYDFLDEQIQKDLLSLVRTCNESIDEFDCMWWLNDQRKNVPSLIIVKEFMVRALDQDNSVIQRTLRIEFEKFFQLVRSCVGFQQLEDEADFNEQGRSVNRNMLRQGSIV
eukprot:403340111